MNTVLFVNATVNFSENLFLDIIVVNCSTTSSLTAIYKLQIGHQTCLPSTQNYSLLFLYYNFKVLNQLY